MKSALLLRALSVALLIGASAFGLSCNVNEYCLNCATGDGGPDGDANDGGDGDANDGGDTDADADAEPCTNTGPEVCDGDDNDCDGQTDEGALPTVGENCDNQMGECAGGVKQCVSGAITCTKPPMPELCDLKDNDCNGLTDEGDPGGGAVCGTNTGECVAGFNRCVNGAIECVGDIGTVGGQPETCNNRDDDCDGMFDEGITNIGPCTSGTNTGECSIGTLMCVGGTPTCVGAVGPTFELCDNLDQDCDGSNINGYNLATDPQNCGACGMVCMLDRAFEGCVDPDGGGAMPPACTIVACETGYHNNNGMVADGCEFGPCTITGAEVCNGMDDDCSGAADEGLTPPANLCRSVGQCGTGDEQTVGTDTDADGSTSMCAGAMGFTCTYNDPDVTVDGQGQILSETLCDGKDNDCDGRVDEGQPNLGLACDNGGVGECRSSGSFQCNVADLNGPAVCVYTQVGSGMGVETCDGKDNDCNGQTDEGATTGNLPGQEWINVPNSTPPVQMMKYEASRPDATGVLPGTTQTVACSRPSVQPWTNVTYPTAVQACQSIGARLCTEAEWQQTCLPPTTYPVTGPATTGTTDFVFIEAEDAFANTTIGTPTVDRAWAKVAPASFNGVTAMQVPDLGFSVSAAANALAESSRLDYRLDLLGSTNYRVWLRMRSPAQASVHGVPTTATATLAPVSNAATEVGDLVIVTTWTVGGAGVPTHTLQSGFTELVTVAHDDGSSDGRLSVAYMVATTAGAQTYQAYTSASGTTDFTGINVIKNGRYTLANLLAQGTNDTGNNRPDPPSAGTLVGPYAVLAIGAWHLTSATTVATSAPSGFSEEWEVLGSNAGELAVATGTGANPGQFGDNVSPNGTASATIAISITDITSNSVWVGLTPGTTPGAANAGNVLTTANDQWQWVVSPQLTSGAAGVHTFSIYTRTDGVYVDTIAVSRQSTTSPTFDDAWAYQTNPRTAQPQTCNSDDYDTDTAATGDQDGIMPTGSLPMCFANHAGTDDAFDLTGNVKEWTQARAAGQNPLRGGASNNEVQGTTCGLDFTLANDSFFFPNVGFRCCR